MQRRQALKLIGTGIALGAAARWEVANAFVKQQADTRSLRALYDPNLSERGHATFAWKTGATHGISSGHPFVIGLGRRASDALARMHAGCMTSPGSDPCSDPGLSGPQLEEDWLHTQLDSCTAAILVVDSTDPNVPRAAWYWARHISLYQRIGLRAVLLLGRDGSYTARPLDSAMEQHLHGVLRIEADNPDAEIHTAALLLDGWFQQNDAVTVITADEIRDHLTQGRPIARCHAIEWQDDCHRAMRQAVATWTMERQGSVLAWFHATQDLSMDEFQQTCAALSQYLTPSAALGVSVIIRPDWAGSGRRAFSLVSTGKREWTAQAVQEATARLAAPFTQ